MSSDSRSDEIREKYLTMQVVDRQRFLAAYAHELTILARGHFANREWEAACECNESIHRVVADLSSSPRERDPGADRSFVDMLLVGAKARGWSWILHQTILRTMHPDARG